MSCRATSLLGEWLEQWLNNYKKHSVRPSTWESYQVIMNTHIIPAVGKIPLKRLKAANLQQMYAEKLKTVGKRGTPLSTRYVRYMHAIVRQALQQAVKEKLVPYNAADATQPPRLIGKEMSILSEEEIGKLLEAIKDDRYYLAYKLAVATGARRGEVLGLCWDCVDFYQETKTIKRQLLALKDDPQLDHHLKTKAGKRNITLPPGITKELKALKKMQSKEQVALGEAYVGNPHNLVFTREDGSAINPQDFSKHFQRLCERAGLPRIRLHDLRHSHASLLLKKNIHPKVVQERLGHSSITMTLDLYSHLTPGLQKEAADVLGDIFKVKESSPISIVGSYKG